MIIITFKLYIQAFGDFERIDAIIIIGTLVYQYGAIYLDREQERSSFFVV
jgi:hypothetical protein